MLISVIVITYNSSPWIRETLESIYAQSYREIELIVSDDCSTDETLAVCRQWVDEHQDRFERTVVTQTPKNGGICANYNHALREATGEYIKYIAGDDKLKANCIERYVANIEPDVKLYFSSADRITAQGTHACTIHSLLPNSDARKQLRMMLKEHPLVFGPTLFLERATLEALGGFDEQYPMSEDYPILMKYLTHGRRSKQVAEPLVEWRMHADSVSHSKDYNFSASVKKAILHYSWKYSWRFGLIFTPYHNWVDFWVPEHYHKGGLYRMVGYLLRSVDVIHWRIKLKGYPEPLRSEE